VANKIQSMLSSEEYSTWKENLKKAKKELSWEEERKVLINLIKTIQ
jgi:hypothetical protein